MTTLPHDTTFRPAGTCDARHLTAFPQRGLPGARWLARVVPALVAATMLWTATPAAAAGPATHDDVARFLAGLDPSDSTAVSTLPREGVWKQHARAFDTSWQALERRQLSRIRVWTKENMTERQNVLFYMFSGPDYLYADAFFPDAETYVLAGLEPVGPIPAIGDVQRRGLGSALAGLRNSLNSILNYSFFITKSMKSDFAGSGLTGTLPVLYVFLARSGKTIRDVRLVDVDAAGNLVEAGTGTPKGAAQGAQITFHGADGRDRTLYYFRTDLSDGGLRRSGFLEFLRSRGNGDAFVKSASYLMHSDSFSTIRGFLLERAVSLLQDDSGVPVRYFDADEWQLKPFGRYPGPIPLFYKNRQPALSELFNKPSTPRIDFGVGYRWRANESALLLARSKVRRSAARP